MSEYQVAVLGGGSWGTTLADVIAKNNHQPTIYCRNDETVEQINQQHKNPKYLGDHRLSRRVTATTDLWKAVEGRILLILAVPAQSFRSLAQQLGDVLKPDQLVLHTTKGLERDTHCRMSTVLQQETCARQVGVIAGPTIASEIWAEKSAGLVVASRFPKVLQVAQEAIASPLLKFHSTKDVAGVEWAGALKNIVAIAAGIATELNVGENAKALMVTQGFSELSRLATTMGALPDTLAGLAGVGDLFVTCSSPLSRNFRIGQALARGESREQAIETLQTTAEGIYTAEVCHQLLKKHSLQAPLLETTYKILYEDLSPDAIVKLGTARKQDRHMT